MFNKRVKKNKIKYLIEWINSLFYENFWKLIEHFNNAQKVINNFEHVKEQKKLIVKFKRTNAKAKKNKFKEIAAVFSELQAALKKQNKLRKNNWLRNRV